MSLNSIYFGPKYLYRDYLKVKVYPIWVHLRAAVLENAFLDG